MERKGLFATVEGLADAVQRKFGCQNWSWGVRLAIVLFWDFGVDIPLRIIFWPFFFLVPGISHIVRGFLDLLLTFINVALFGSMGFFYAVEIIMPDGFVWDLIPMSTITWCVAFWREKRGTVAAVRREEYVFDEGEEEAQEFGPRYGIADFSGGGFMARFLLGGAGGLLVGLLYLWLEIASGGGVVGLTLVGGVLGLAAFGLRNVARLQVAVGLAGIAAALLALVLGRIYYLDSTKPENYRQAAWRELKVSEDAWVLGAEKLDNFGKSEGVRAAKEMVSSLLEKGKEALREKLEETEETGIGIVDGLVSSLKDMPEKREEKKKEASKPSPETVQLKKETEALELGPAQAKLYSSSYVLEQAKKTRKDLISFWSWLSLVPSMLLLFAGLLFLQAGDSSDNVTPQTRRNFSADPNLDWT